jgi:glycosyltransferase involved in cell wall biosynthesis
VRPLLSLVMIVKDEAANLRAVLESARRHVDRYTILDTGSTDGTQDIVREMMVGIPGSLHEHPFEGYAASRNRALDLDGGILYPAEDPAEFQLVLSGDEYLREGQKLRQVLEEWRDKPEGLFRLRVSIDGAEALQPRVFRASSPWHYEDGDLGVDEYPAHPNADEPQVALLTPWIEHSVSDRERRLRTIAEVHIPLIEEALERDPYNARALVFLAQKYEALFGRMQPWELTKYAMEAMSLYARRLALESGTQEERDYCRYRYLDLGILVGVFMPKEALERAGELKRADSKRPEPALLCAIAAAQISQLPIRKVYELAVEAARVAEEAKSCAWTTPVNAGCLGRAHSLAATLSLELLRRLEPGSRALQAGENIAALVRHHVEKALDAGAPLEELQGLLDNLQSISVASQAS